MQISIPAANGVRYPGRSRTLTTSAMRDLAPSERPSLQSEAEYLAFEMAYV
jgi:hypothetical protein